METIYGMTAVDIIPNNPKNGRNSGRWVNQLRRFIESDNMQVKVELPQTVLCRAYAGLVQASKRPEFNGKVQVMKNRTNVYLIREG